VLENGCYKSLKKQSLSEWKVSQLKREYQFIYDGLMLFGEVEGISYNDLTTTQQKIEKSQYFYDLASKELTAYSSEEIKESERLNQATCKRNTRLKQKALEYIKTNSAIFLTLTFNDDVFKNMSKETRRRMITRFLKKTCKSYFANIDYGKKNDREHYHALVVPMGDSIDNTTYSNMFYGSSIKFQRVKVRNTKNCSLESTSKKISKYVNKLSNHAIKNTTQGCRIIYSKS